MRLRPLVVLGFASSLTTAGVIAACGGDDVAVTATDAGADAAHEAGTDATAGDTGVDAPAPVDASHDAGADAHDAAVDAHDAAVDAPGEAAADAADGATTVTDAGEDAPPIVDAAFDAARPKHAVLVLVHASADFPSLRVCFATPNSVAPIPALPHIATAGQPYPGIDPGTAMVLPDLEDLSKTALTPYLIDASKIATATLDAGRAEPTCDTLIGSDGKGGTLSPDTDYVALPTLPAGTFPVDTTEVVAFTGCLPQARDPNAGAAKCGPAYDATNGNLVARVFATDRAFSTQTAIGALVAHAATPLGAAPVAASLLVPDGGAPTTIATVVLGGEGPAQSVPYADYRDPASVLSVATLAGDGGVVSEYQEPLADTAVPGITTSSDAGTYFYGGESYTFVLVGDPAAAAGTPSALHALAIPAHTTPPRFQ